MMYTMNMDSCERFWSKVNRLGSVHFPHCWEWTGARVRGYGQAWFDGRQQPAHRVAYALLVEPVPSDLVCDHLCRNKCCVNPAHIEPTTVAENTRRGLARVVVRQAIAARSRNQLQKTHCKRGHVYSETKVTQGKGKMTRRCSVCANELRRQRTRAAAER